MGPVGLSLCVWQVSMSVVWLILIVLAQSLFPQLRNEEGSYANGALALEAFPLVDGHDGSEHP